MKYRVGSPLDSTAEEAKEGGFGSGAACGIPEYCSGQWMLFVISVGNKGQ
jgi:hypothetical protein